MPQLAGTQFASEHSDLALKGVAEGTVDIVVGTHKLLSQDTHFKNLGLLIIDVEHCFGARRRRPLRSPTA